MCISLPLSCKYPLLYLLRRYLNNIAGDFDWRPWFQLGLIIRDPRSGLDMRFHDGVVVTFKSPHLDGLLPPRWRGRALPLTILTLNYCRSLGGPLSFAIRARVAKVVRCHVVQVGLTVCRSGAAFRVGNRVAARLPWRASDLEVAMFRGAPCVVGVAVVLAVSRRLGGAAREGGDKARGEWAEGRETGAQQAAA